MVDLARQEIVWHSFGVSLKQSILDAIRRLPDNATFDDAINAIEVLQRIEEGERAADEGRVRSHQDVRELIQSWVST